MALKRKRLTKKSAKQDRRIVGKERKTLPCKECGDDVPNLGADIIAVTCSWCVVRMVAPPDLPAKPKPPGERNPRGWQFMKEYRAPDGTLYHRGVKVDEEIPKQPTNRGKRPSVRKTSSTTAKKSNNSGHPKRTDAESTTRKSDTKRKSSVTAGRSVAGNKAKRPNSTAKKSVKRKARGSTVR